MNIDGDRIMMISTHGYVSAEPEFGKADTGGQVVYVLELSKCLARLGFEVDIFTRQFDGQAEMEPVAEGVTVRRFPCGGDEFIPKEFLCDSLPEWVDQVADFIRSEQREYCLINSHYWDAGLAGQALSNRFGIQHFHTPHSIGVWKRDNMPGGSDELEQKYNFRRRIRAEKSIYDECDLVIATSPVQRKILEQGEYEVADDRIRVIPPGYDDRRFFPVSNATRSAIKRELDLDGKIILALGRIARNKGYDLLIQAMPTVFERIDNARLLLAIGSTDPSDAELQQVDRLRELVSQLELEDRVLFRDYIPDDQLADYYRGSDVFALSSRYEPFGMTAVESMACGTPAVVTTEGGLWEQICWGTEALYANPFDPPAFGHAISSILQYPPIASQLARQGSQKARARFTWTGIAQQMAGLLDDTATRQRATSKWRSSEASIAGESLWKSEACL